MTPLRILHLEDSARDAALVEHRLSSDGLSCSILLAKDREAFETALAAEPFDLIISDYNLPGYNGVAALKQAQAIQPDVPVILVSGTVVEEQAVRCLHIGATDYLIKQRLERLVPAVERAIQDADARRAQRRTEAALGESESRKAAILDSVLDSIVTMDASGVVIEFNAAAARTFGYSKTEAIGRSLADLIIPARLRERHGQGMARYLQTGSGPLVGRMTEMTAMRSDGSEIPVELTVTSIQSGASTVFIGVMRDITARQHADATRTRLASIVDASNDAIFSMAFDETVLTWNAGAERLYGYTANEIIGRSRTLLVPIEKRDELTAIMAGAAQGDAGQPLETRRIRKDGSVVDISLVISPMIDADGSIASVSTIARDITSRKQAETELRHAYASVREERDRAQRYLDTADVILLSLDRHGRIILVNRYACDLLGWECAALVGRDFIETCLPARMRASMRAQLKLVLAGDLSSAENPVLTRSGGERLIEWRNTVLRDDAGGPIGTFSCGTDVTDRNQAIESLRQTEERMRFALQVAHVGIWDMNHITGVLRWSGDMETQYGFRPGEFDGTFAAFEQRIHPDDRASMSATIAEAAKSGADFTELHRTRWPDGTVRWLSGAGRVILDDAGVALRAVGISQDVTERRLLEDQYQQAQKMEAIGQLAAGVAHDFNNLLTVILGFCELLLVDLDPADARQADIAEIQKAGVRAAGLTRQLLAFSRKEIIEPRRLDLNEIVSGIRVLLERLIGEDVKVVLIMGRAVAAVTADRGQLEQIILNLAVNARDAMPRGGTLTIATSNVEFAEERDGARLGLAAGRYVALAVSDTGTGMTPEVKTRLFEPFFTTKGVGKGTGLGLATVHGIVMRSGGALDVDSYLGRGTTFTVYLPQAAGGEQIAVVAPAPVKPRGMTHTVLVVEDAEGLRELTKRLLERQGYAVLVAANAEDALLVFERNPAIELLLTDVVMPGASGPELVTRLMEQRPALKVIYMSGYTDDAIVHHGILDPGIAFVHKPFTSVALARKIRDVLDL